MVSLHTFTRISFLLLSLSLNMVMASPATISSTTFAEEASLIKKQTSDSVLVSPPTPLQDKPPLPPISKSQETYSGISLPSQNSKEELILTKLNKIEETLRSILQTLKTLPISPADNSLDTTANLFPSEPSIEIGDLSSFSLNEETDTMKKNDTTLFDEDNLLSEESFEMDLNQDLDSTIEDNVSEQEENSFENS